MNDPAIADEIADGAREQLLGEITAGEDPHLIVLQSVAELQRGLQVLDYELKTWAKIGTAHGRRQVGSTMLALNALAQLQDTLMPLLQARRAGAEAVTRVRETSGVDAVTAYQWTCAACHEVGLELDEDEAEQRLYEHEDERHD